MLPVMIVPTASKTKSDAGSIMSCISSFTDTTGFMSPSRPGAVPGVALAGAGAEDGDEHAAMNALAASSPGMNDSRFMRGFYCIPPAA